MTRFSRKAFFTTLALLVAGPAQAQDPALMAKADSLSIAAMDHLDWGRFMEAEDALRQALGIDLEVFGSDHVMVAHTRHDLAWVLSFDADQREAENLYAQAEEVYCQMLGVSPPEGRIRFSKRVEVGRPVLKRVRTRRQDALDMPDLNRARALNNLGWLFGRTGANPITWDLLTEAIRLEEEADENPIELAISYHNRLLYGWVDLTYESTWMERAKRALPLFVEHRSEQSVLPEIAHRMMLIGVAEASEIMRTVDDLKRQVTKFFGPDHYQLGLLEHERAAWIWRGQGPVDEVFIAEERSLEVLTGAFGFRHREVQHGLVTLIYFLTDAGRWSEADSLFHVAKSVADEIYLPEDRENIRILAQQGRLFELQGRYEEAGSVLLRAAYLFGQIDDPASQAQNLGFAASVMIAQGRLAEAEGIAQEAITIQKGLAEIYSNPIYAHPESNPVIFLPLATVYARQERFEEARAILDRVRSVSADFYGSRAIGVARSLSDLASVYLSQGALDEAEPLALSALEMRREGHTEPYPELGLSLASLGHIGRARGQFQKADVWYLEALQVMEASVGVAHPMTARALVDLVGNRSEAGDVAASDVDLLNRAIDILSRGEGLPESRIEALALRASLQKASGDKRGALDDMEEALEILDHVRPSVGGGEEIRAGFMERYAGFYDAMVGWLIEDGDTERAWEYSERGRARVMLDQLAAGRIPLLREDIPEDLRTELEERESKAKADLAEAEYRISRLRSRTDVEPSRKRAELADLEEKLLVASRDFEAVYNEIKNASPLWRDQLTSGGSPVRLSVFQRSALGSGGIMLSYQLGSEQSLVFVIGTDRRDVTAWPLTISAEGAAVLGVDPGPAKIASIRAVMSGHDGGLINDLMTRSRIAGGRRGPASASRLHALFQVLVPEEVRERLLTASEVIIAPDDALNSLPFEALVVDLARNDPRYWLDDAPPVRYTASATVLYNLEERQAPGFGMTEPVLLTVADPVYDISEIESMVSGGSGANAISQDRGASADAAFYKNVRGDGTLARLPGTRKESQEIVDVATSAQTRVVKLQGLDATEANLRDTVADKRYVHVAAHGLVGGPRGSLFASLALTPDVARSGTDNDGYLQLHEIYDLPLDATELAVLSACQTNVGKIIEGEGVFALSRGFLAAGARRVVASQWAVDDASTAALMGQFFQAISSADRKGESPDFAASLAEAKKAIRADERWSDPYYWAPFVLAGKQ